MSCTAQATLLELTKYLWVFISFSMVLNRCLAAVEVVRKPGKNKWPWPLFRGDRWQTLSRLCDGGRRSCRSVRCGVSADVQDRTSCVQWGLHPDKTPPPQRKVYLAATEAGPAAEVGAVESNLVKKMFVFLKHVAKWLDFSIHSWDEARKNPSCWNISFLSYQ